MEKNNKIFIKEKIDISSIDSITLQNNSNNINQIISNISSKKNSSSETKDSESPNCIEYDNINTINPFEEEDSYQKKELEEYYNNFYN